MSGSRASNCLDSVVLPAPDGDDSTNRSPRRAMVDCVPELLNVLHLLAKLIDHGLELKADVSKGRVCGF